MSVPPEVLDVVRGWVAHAEEDLFVAEHLLAVRERHPFSTSCFHAQQSAEKYLKALLSLYSVPFPKTHDLLALVHLIPPPIGTCIEPAVVGSLNRYSVATRYPGDWELITRAETEGAVAIARGVREAVRGYLPSDVLGQ